MWDILVFLRQAKFKIPMNQSKSWKIHWLCNNFDTPIGIITQFLFFVDKTYHSADHEAHRQEIFNKNVDVVEKHNSNGSHSYKLEINEFADLTSDEFNAIYNGYKEPVNKMVI